MKITNLNTDVFTKIFYTLEHLFIFLYIYI